MILIKSVERESVEIIEDFDCPHLFFGRLAVKNNGQLIIIGMQHCGKQWWICGECNNISMKSNKPGARPHGSSSKDD